MQHADGQMHIRQTQYYLLAVACQPGELFLPPLMTLFAWLHLLFFQGPLLTYQDNAQE